MQLPVNGERSQGAILSRRFTDIDQMAELIQAFSKVQLTQLSVKALLCDLLMAVFDEARFIFAKSSCPIFMLGEKPRDAITFSLILETTGPHIVSHNRQVSHQTLSGFDLNLEARFVMPPHVHFVNVQINRDVLQNYLNVMDRSDLDKRLLTSNYVHIPETVSAVRTYLQQLLHLIQHQPHFLQQSQIKKLLLDDFIPLLINAIPPITNNIVQPPPSIRRSQLVKQAEDYMLAYMDQPLTLKDLCQSLYVSERSLFYGFQDVFGVSPMEYLKTQRLQCVRRSLKAADPETASVTVIAQRYGFWSAGHFARDYQQMFGELPSETLKQTITLGKKKRSFALT